ncbi:MAG TPA: hydrogenase, partial [bacterium (Candidatus Stahlbacteria)]|nr:hydrogenase [Candidatus Stahlbacteria bacterium]
MQRINNINELENLRKKIIDERDSNKQCIVVSSGTCGQAGGSEEVIALLKEEIKRHGLDGGVNVRVSGCLGFCEREPIMIIYPQGIFYPSVKVDDIPEIVKETVVNGRILDHLLYVDPLTGKRIAYEHEVPFYKKQKRLIFGSNSKIEPTSITDYISIGGYTALAKVLSSMTPTQVIKTIKRAGLRGRGGAGFPTGVKWEYCRKARSDIKYIICNADEGDPGAYANRGLIEGNPHSVLEGMIIGAYAIGANQGFVFVRAEYPMAVEYMAKAIKQAEEYGFLGKNILGTDFGFTVRISRGAGAFVCGEETALIASIESKPGEPRLRPPYPAQKGLWEKPTIINNVETWANIPLIINKGADWFSNIGTEKSKGTKIFSLVGKVNNTGLVEVPMGITLREIIYDIGGGIRDAKRFKAVQTGGPSGGCIPRHLINLPVDFEKLTEAGAMMGSGGMIVMDEDTCMVDVAKYFVNFLKDESCGKCTSCREGLIQMHHILTEITEGRGKEAHIELLKELSNYMIDASLCALGRTAPNPVLTTLRYFRDEYEAHIKHKKCPATVCKKIIFTPCKYNCPIGTDVPAFVALIAHGRYQEAFEVIRKENPFPIVCGYVCHHPCEDRCRSGEVGDPIAIKALKRFVGEYQLRRGIKPKVQAKQAKLEQVAIIGAGPAGLAAGYDLANL